MFKWFSFPILPGILIAVLLFCSPVMAQSLTGFAVAAIGNKTQLFTVTANDTFYPVESLVGVDLLFGNNQAGGNLTTLLTPDFRAVGQRAALLDGDTYLNTGLQTVGSALGQGFGVRFLSPIRNRPGVDVVLFEVELLPSVEPAVFRIVSPDGPFTRTYTVADYTVRGLITPTTRYGLVDGAASLSQLETKPVVVGDTSVGRFFGLGIDLSDLGIREGNSASTLFFSADPGSFSPFDPVFLAGLPSPPDAPEPGTFCLVLIGCVLFQGRRKISRLISAQMDKLFNEVIVTFRRTLYPVAERDFLSMKCLSLGRVLSQCSSRYVVVSGLILLAMPFPGQAQSLTGFAVNANGNKTELFNVVANDQIFPTSTLLGFDLVSWNNQSVGEVGTFLTPDVPAVGQRAALLSNDIFLNTGLLNVGNASGQGFGIQFVTPLSNRPGVDLVLFEAGFSSLNEPAPFRVRVPGVSTDSRLFTASDYTVRGGFTPARQFRTSGGVLSADALETSSLIPGDTTTGQFFGLGIDLSDLGVPDEGAVSTLFFSAEAGSPQSFDPVFLAGLPTTVTVNAPEPGTLTLFVMASGFFVRQRRQLAH